VRDGGVDVGDIIWIEEMPELEGKCLWHKQTTGNSWISFVERLESLVAVSRVTAVPREAISNSK
jgi:hypothetical protein